MTKNQIDNKQCPPTHRDLLQLVFDEFNASGKWPNSRDLQVAFLPNDFWSVVEEIDFHLMSNRGDKNFPDSETVLSIEGIAICNSSEKHMDLFIHALAECVKAFKNDPRNAIITASQLRESMSLNEKDTLLVMELLLVARRIWTGASRDANQRVNNFTLYPDVLKFGGVSNFGQYLDVVTQNRPKKSQLNTNYTVLVKPNQAHINDFSNLHPEIAQKCERLFFGENYSESVEASFKLVRDQLRELTGYERGSEAFGQGHLHISGAAADNVDKDFNEGVKYILMAIDCFRNEKSHTSNDQIREPQHAIDYLRVSSLAMKFLERAEILDLTKR